MCLCDTGTEFKVWILSPIVHTLPSCSSDDDLRSITCACAPPQWRSWYHTWVHSEPENVKHTWGGTQKNKTWINITMELEQVSYSFYNGKASRSHINECRMNDVLGDDQTRSVLLLGTKRMQIWLTNGHRAHPNHRIYSKLRSVQDSSGPWTACNEIKTLKRCTINQCQSSKQTPTVHHDMVTT